MAVTTLDLPRLGETMEQGRIVGWLKAPGDAFRRGETLLEIETDKTVVELPALVSGVLVEILAAEGAEVSVGMPIARIEAEGGAEGGGTAPAAAAEQPGTEAAPAAEPRLAAAQPAPAAVRRDPSRESGGTRASPLARRLAREGGVDIAALAGTGRRGRVTGEDVRAALAGAGDARAEDRLAFRDGALALRHWRETGRHRGTLVLVHGFGGDAGTWAGLAAGLARAGWRSVAPDLPSHGRTSVEAGGPEDLAAAVSALLAGQDGPVTVVAHSLGAVAAVQAVASAAPGSVERLILLAPAGLGSDIDDGFLAAWAAARTRAGLTHALRRLAVRPPAYSEAQLDQLLDGIRRHPGLAALAEAVASGGHQQLDIVGPLEGLDIPVAVVMGLEDRIIPWTQIAALPPQVAIHLVAGAGHMPHWDRPEEVRRLIG